MIKVQGLDEIKKVLNGLPDQFRHKVLQASNAEAAAPLVERAHLLAPVGRTGHLAESIGVVKPTLAKAGEVGLVQVGPRRKGGYKGYHAHLVEYGTKDRGRTGIMPKKPFMEPAFNQTKDILFKRIDDIQGKKLMQFMKRTIKSTGGTWSKM